MLIYLPLLTSCVAAFTGAAVGAALATLQSNPVLRGTITSTASFVLLMGCFASELHALLTESLNVFGAFHLQLTPPDELTATRLKTTDICSL